MALRSDWSMRPCPIARSMDFLGDPWSVLVLRELMYGVHRFEELREHTEAPDKILSDRLTQMIARGLVRREQYAGTVRPRYDYFLTSAGEAARPVLQALAAWGHAYTPEPNLAQGFQMVCPNCATRAPAHYRCDRCGTELTTAESMWVRPRAPEFP
ncbi:MAG: transcriptional regulator [Leucobacter sp.]|nr:transcriptional regulator [Leucobacter sp.]